MATDFTIADVLAWARTKPADERYEYGDIRQCALCQFLRETGRALKPIVGPVDWNEEDDTRVGGLVPAQIDGAARAYGDYGSYDTRWTFGRLVKRLEALCPEVPVTQSNWAAIDAYLNDLEQVQA